MQPITRYLPSPPFEDTSSAFVTSGMGMDELLFTIFLAVGVAAVLFQFVPGLMLFSAMVKGIFSFAEVKSAKD